MMSMLANMFRIPQWSRVQGKLVKDPTYIYLVSSVGHLHQFK